MASNSSSAPRHALVGAVAVLAVLGGAFWYSDLYLGTYLVNILHYYALPLLIVVIGVVLGLVLLAMGRVVSAGVLVAVGVIGMFGVGAYGSYAQAKAYASEYTENQEDLRGFAERTAWEVAANRVDSDKGDLSGAVQWPTYRATDEVFGTIVEAPGYFSGSAGVIEQSISSSGATEATTCSFGEGDGADGYRLDGNFDASLQREISHHDRGVKLEYDDAYGYCDDDVAVTVVPLTKLAGFFPVLEEPAGVAIYREGEVSIMEDVEAGAIPGPVYPTSLAATQRASLSAVDSSWYTWMRNRAGYTEATTAGDPNDENPTEFILADPELDSTYYVTPMTNNPKQSQAKITSYVVMPADGVQAGERQEMELVLVPLEERREANGVVVDNIKSFYSDADYGWAQGLKVFEMVPAAEGEWVASLGYEKSIKFRVRLTADGASCIEDTQGNELRCVDASGQVIGDEVDPGSEPALEGTPLEDMTAEQLAALQDSITAEWLRRDALSAE